ncbi:MAG: cytochrome c3 family protein [Desulfobacteraceae bacterium]|nr:cytochrome c3 family protein [Desulfobacteraceae bacterium]
MKIRSTIMAICLLLIARAWARGAVLDAPHNETNHIGCASCHTYSMWWQYSPAARSASPDYYSIVNTLCLTCHGPGGPGPQVLSHSGAALQSTTYHHGQWAEACTICHDPHEQRQFYWARAGLNPYLVTGQMTGVTANAPSPGQTTIDYANAVDNPQLSVWSPSAWGDKSAGNPGRGLILVLNQIQAVNTYSVLSATASQIVVKGIINPNEISTTSCPQSPDCAGADTFGLLYGQYVRNTINTPAGGARQVKFLDPLGGFVDPNSLSPTGICQVCHTLTHYWDANGANASHNPGVNCATCHFHKNGFKPQFPPHDTLVGKDAACVVCHYGTDTVLDIHRGLCGHCHTQPPALALPADRQNVIAIQPGTCTTCHGPVFSHPKATHSNISGPNCAACHDTANIITGLHQGNCLICHASSKTPVINAISNGQVPGATLTCESCHDGTASGAATHGTTPATVAPLHDKFDPTPACAACHPNGSAEQRLSLHQTCVTCHQSPDPTVTNAIASGMAGALVQCVTCHHDDIANLHHQGNPNTATGNCTWCHADPRYGWSSMRPGDNGGTNDLPTQLPCAQCHVRVSGSTIYIDKIVINGDYSQSPTRTVQHTISGVTSGYIYNYGMCLSCHDGVNAQAVGLYHARPITANSSDRYSKMLYAPGRGTFNLFWASWHGQENAPFGNEHFKGNQNRYQAPGISFQMLAVPCLSNNGCTGSPTSYVPILPAKPAPTPAGDPVHHNFTVATACAPCHASDNEAARTVGLHSACARCHTSTLPSVINTILAGINGTAATCVSCHDGTTAGAPSHGLTAAEAASAHINLSAAASCIVCHTPNGGTFANLYTLHRSDCLTCHASTRTEVQATIAAGRSGTAVNCTGCHPSNPHHASAAAQAGHCTYCHTDPRSAWSPIKPGDNGGSSPYPTQLACKTCHVRVSGNAIYIDKITTNGNYAVAPTRTVQHTLDGTHADIDNYGICFSCHNGVKAKLVNPFHAKPAAPPSVRNRFANMAHAPGRGTFNLFWSSWHGKEGTSWGNASYQQDNHRYQAPTINFKKIAVPCGSFNGCSGSNTIQVPVLPALGI